MALLFKNVNNGQKLFVMNFTIDFCSREFMRAICNRMELSIFAILRGY
jgi:NADH:ubiquinone oxidoreductase subunit B-like Fe-S oxidoreductase